MEIKKTRKKMYNNGITLIALIITIIVLLILAGVTINLTLGENGIFKTAEMAGKNYTQAQEKELAGLASLENTINNIVGGIDNNEEIKYQTLKEVAVPGDYVKYDTGIAGLGENKERICLLNSKLFFTCKIKWRCIRCGRFTIKRSSSMYFTKSRC